MFTVLGPLAFYNSSHPEIKAINQQHTMHTNRTSTLPLGFGGMIDTHTMTGERFKSIVTTIFTDDFVELCFSGEHDANEDVDEGLIQGLLTQCAELESWRKRGFSHRLVLFHSLDVAGATTDYLSLWLVDLQELANSYDIYTDELRRSTRKGRPNVAFHERMMCVLAKNPDEDVLKHMYRHELQHSILHNRQQLDDKISAYAMVSVQNHENVRADIAHLQNAIKQLQDVSSYKRQQDDGDVHDSQDDDTNSNKWICVYMCFAGVLVYHIYFG